MSGNPNVSLLDANYASTTPRVIDWTANTQYAAQQVVLYSGTLYRAKTQFTSGSSFTVSNWDLVDSGSYPQWYICSGLDTTGASDVSAAIQAKIDAAAAATNGGIVYVPEGTYQLVSSLTPKSNVAIVGAGRGKTIFQPVGLVPAFRNTTATNTTPLTDMRFADFTIDGSNQAGTYATSIKGIYATFLLRCTFTRLHVHDTGATGVGVDYLADCTFDDVIVEGCGRLGTTSSAGAAGIGIGVNNTLINNTIQGATVRNCVTRNNKRCGLFFESQDGTYGINYRVVNHISHGNGEHGIADAGCDGLQVVGGQSWSNTKSGFAAYVGTTGTAVPGKNGTVTGLDCFSNTENGFHYDASGSTAAVGGYTFQSGKSHGNTKHGVLVQPNGTAAHDLIDMTTQDMDVYGNARSGVGYSSANGGTGSGIKRGHITNNRIHDNGSSGSTPYGVLINCNITDPDIFGNKIWDDQGSVTQATGIINSSGCALTGYGRIKNNDLRGNTGGFNQAGTLASTILVINNPGYNPQGPAAISVTASPFTYTAGNTPEIVYIDGGTVSLVVKGGTTLRTSTGASVPLAPAEAVVVTYSVAPTMTKDRQ